MKISIKHLVCFVVAVVSLSYLLSSGCSRHSQNAVTLAGSTAFQPFAEKLAERFMSTHPGMHINVQGGGSAVGIQSAMSGAAEIGMADLPSLPKDASSLNSVAVARDGISVIVNPQNPVSNLTSDELKKIFAGKIVNWKEVGGKDLTVRVISREDGSGTRRSFDTLALGGEGLSKSAMFQNSNGTVREAVASDPAAIGYLSMALVNDKVKALSYNGMAPDREGVKIGRYPLARPVFFLTKADVRPAVKEFIDYVLSDESQQLLEKEGLIAAR